MPRNKVDYDFRCTVARPSRPVLGIKKRVLDLGAKTNLNAEFVLPHSHTIMVECQQEGTLTIVNLRVDSETVKTVFIKSDGNICVKG